MRRNGWHRLIPAGDSNRAPQTRFDTRGKLVANSIHALLLRSRLQLGYERQPFAQSNRGVVDDVVDSASSDWLPGAHCRLTRNRRSKRRNVRRHVRLTARCRQQKPRSHPTGTQVRSFLRRPFAPMPAPRPHREGASGDRLAGEIFHLGRHRQTRGPSRRRGARAPG